MGVPGETGGPRRSTGNHRQDDARADPGQSQPDDTPESGDEYALSEELAQDAPLASAERNAESHLFLSRDGACELQSADVGAGNQENDADGEHHDGERLRELAARAGQTGLGGREGCGGSVAGSTERFRAG